MKSLYFIFIGFILVFWACITKHDLVKQSGNAQKLPLDSTKINGLYKNWPDSTSGISLWGALFHCKSFKRDSTKATKTSMVRLRLDNNDQLHVTVMDSSRILNSIVLEAKIEGNYLFVKRNYLLIPFPVIFYHEREERAALYVRTDGSLGMSYERRQFIWILVAGSVHQEFNSTYKRLSN